MVKLYLTGSDRFVEQLLLRCDVHVVCITESDLRDLALPKAPQPEVVMLDLRANPQLPDGVWTLRRYHPATPIVAILSTLDPALMLEAMRAGVNECVAEPLTTA